ncbi:hypothetical protein LTR05_008484 [Lithohypha guttulata]|uniref:Uncharacterized protein n=1 Tax=Lithohypha guttulata TaxID=1690604 RepID=A0AAN7QCJ9_9EURO|nr:hypothetical protein LTR05_008484 [Lithohypha guttulata]
MSLAIPTALPIKAMQWTREDQVSGQAFTYSAIHQVLHKVAVTINNSSIDPAVLADHFFGEYLLVRSFFLYLVTWAHQKGPQFRAQELLNDGLPFHALTYTEVAALVGAPPHMINFRGRGMARDVSWEGRLNFMFDTTHTYDKWRQTASFRRDLTSWTTWLEGQGGVHPRIIRRFLQHIGVQMRPYIWMIPSMEEKELFRIKDDGRTERCQQSTWACVSERRATKRIHPLGNAQGYWTPGRIADNVLGTVTDHVQGSVSIDVLLKRIEAAPTEEEEKKEYVSWLEGKRFTLGEVTDGSQFLLGHRPNMEFFETFIEGFNGLRDAEASRYQGDQAHQGLDEGSDLESFEDEITDLEDTIALE